MIRKVRHPYQVLEASEMVVGQLYAFIYARPTGDEVFRYTMGGVIDDTHATARRLGHDLDSEDPPIELLPPDAGPIVTVHMDGWWYKGNPAEDPTLMYWRRITHSLFSGSHILSSYLGPVDPANESDGYHSIVVPNQRWNVDPCIHVAYWNNPDDVIERAGAVVAESAAGWERRMRAKAHAAMAQALGF